MMKKHWIGTGGTVSREKKQKCPHEAAVACNTGMRAVVPVSTCQSTLIGRINHPPHPFFAFKPLHIPRLPVEQPGGVDLPGIARVLLPALAR